MLHPNPMILSAVQDGECADIDATNPYDVELSREDMQKFLGWEAGHKRTLEEHELQQRIASQSWWRRLKCKLGLHSYAMKKIQGRSHVDHKTGDIVGRDAVIKKYTCVFCDDVYFINLEGSPRDQDRRRLKFRREMGWK